MEESRSARLLRQIKEICEIAGIKTEEYAKITKKRLDVVSLTRELGRERAALGRRVYDLSRRSDHGDVLEDVTVQAILGRLATLEGGLEDCEEEIATIRRAAGERAMDVKRRHEEQETGAPQAADASAPAEAAEAEISGAVASDVGEEDESAERP